MNRTTGFAHRRMLPTDPLGSGDYTELCSGGHRRCLRREFLLNFNLTCLSCLFILFVSCLSCLSPLFCLVYLVCPSLSCPCQPSKSRERSSKKEVLGRKF